MRSYKTDIMKQKMKSFLYIIVAKVAKTGTPLLPTTSRILETRWIDYNHWHGTVYIRRQTPKWNKNKNY